MNATIAVQPATQGRYRAGINTATACAAFVGRWLARGHIVLPAACALVLGTWFIASASGTPDDDGYIFYQYARNVASGHGLSFNPDQVSYGVTSAAWAFLLSTVHFAVRQDIVLEAQTLGLVFFAASAGLWAVAVRRATGNPWLGLIGAIVFVLELDALKSSIIGLETGLNLAVVAGLAAIAAREPLRTPLLLGAFGGLALLTRPDNIVWLVLIGLYGLVVQRNRFGALLISAVVAALVAAPWYGWLLVNIGSPLPPTQTGKLLVFLPMNLHLTLAEFQHFSPLERIELSIRVLVDFATSTAPNLLATATSAFAAILSCLLVMRRSTRAYGLFTCALAIAVFAQAGLYGWSFPLLKLRYLVNMLPVGIVGSIGGLGVLWLGAPRRAAGWIAVGLIALVVVASFPFARELQRQISNYRQFVAVQAVRSEVGLWLRDNTAPGSLVALEPIGSVAFYADRPILDLGGLTDSTTWPALATGYTNAPAIAELLRTRHVDYLVDYTHPEGIGGVSGALAYLPGAHPVAVVESPLSALGTARSDYASYTIYALDPDHNP